MNSRVLKTGIGILIFLSIIATVIIVMHPIYRQIDNAVRNAERQFVSALEKKTGLKISYKSLSPSILSGLNIKGIVLRDSGSGEEILSAKKTFVSYRLSNLLKGDYEHAFTIVTVRDMNLNLTDEELARLFPGEEEKDESEKYTIARIEELVRKVAFSLPVDLQIKKVNFSYSSGRKNYSVVLRECLVKKETGKSSVYLKLDGNVSSAIEMFDYKTAGFNYRVDGYLLDSISGSSFRIRVDDNRRVEYSLRHLEFLLNYREHNLVIRSTRKFYPLNVRALLNLDSFNLDCTVKSEKLNPLDLFRAKDYMWLIDTFKGTLVTTDSHFAMDFDKNRYSWFTDSEFNMPKGKTFTRHGQNLFAKCSGNNTDITIERLAATGGVFQGDFKGSFNIPRLQPEGTLNLEHYAFAENSRISTVCHFRPRRNEGFDMYMDEVRFGNWSRYTNVRGYSSLGKNIILVLDADDESHGEYGTPGHVAINGALQLGDNMYLQASAKLDNFFLDTGLSTAAFFTDCNGGDYVGHLVEDSKKYITQIEVYFATDFDDFTYNSPVTICANTEEDRQVLFVSFDGSGTSIQFSRVDLMYGNNSLLASGSLDIDTHNDQLSFFTNMTLNSLPYTLNGNYTFGDWLNVTGNYGMEASVNFGTRTRGSLRFMNMPLSYENYTVSLLLDSSFSYSESGDWDVLIDKCEIAELSENYRSRPKVSFAGEINQNGFIASNISYSDNHSSLDGTGYVIWNMMNGNFENAVINLDLASPVSSENINFNAEAKSLSPEDFSFSRFREELYFNVHSGINNFPVSRFLIGQGTGNTVSLELNASGTMENPLFSLNIIDSSILIGGSNLTCRLNSTYIDNIFDISYIDIAWRGFKLDEAVANIDLKTYNGNALVHAKMLGVDKQLDAGFDFVLTNLSDPDIKGVPEAFSIDADCVSLESNFVESFTPFHLSLIRSPGRFDIVTDENLGAYGEITDDGFIAFTVADDKPLHFSMDGTYHAQEIDLNLNSIYWDLSKISYAFNSDIFSLYSGILTGNLRASGYITDPEFEGTLSLLNTDFNSPQFIPEHFTAEEIKVAFEEEEITLLETMLNVSGGLVAANGVISLDRLSLDNMSVNIRTIEDSEIPIDAHVSHFGIKGYTSLDANLVLEDRSLSLNGSVGLRNSVLSVSMGTAEQSFEFNKIIKEKDKIKGKLTKKPQKVKKPTDDKATGYTPSLDFNVNLELLIGQRVQVYVNPFLRSLIAPSTPIYVAADTAAGLWSLKGDIVLRGGEISYLNRNFYLKQGRLLLNETQDNFDPNITVRAETRERDSSGENVTIILSAISQNISNFNAVLSSVPARSENEIMALLGQIVAGDSTSVGNLLVAGMDYGVQVTLLRKFENALRDLCNFDIFSIRTTALQNTIMQGLDMGNRAENNSVIGNLFDNSTVYIGKYFGSDVYADALLHWTYDKKIAGSGEAVGEGLVFQPEIGLEFNAPFANIRWNFAPDLSDFQESWAKSTSITLSWRLAF